MKNVLLTLLVVVVLVLHQDFWNWTDAEPLAFGILPIGLTYHALYTIGVAILLWILVTFAWPSHLENDGDSRQDDSR